MSCIIIGKSIWDFIWGLQKLCLTPKAYCHFSVYKNQLVFFTDLREHKNLTSCVIFYFYVMKVIKRIYYLLLLKLQLWFWPLYFLIISEDDFLSRQFTYEYCSLCGGQVRLLLTSASSKLASNFTVFQKIERCTLSTSLHSYENNFLWV